MVLAIASALAETLASYLFEGYLKANYGSVEIEGAPSWYGSEKRAELCISTFKRGDLESVELAKEDSKIKLEKKLKNIVNVVITKRFENANPDEKRFLETVVSDKKVTTFVSTHTNYKNVKYDEEKKMTFVRNCVLKDEFIVYEKKRLKEMVKELSHYKAGKEFDELNGKSPKSVESHKDKAFDELDGE
jgi:hypothetical protein